MTNAQEVLENFRRESEERASKASPPRPRITLDLTYEASSNLVDTRVALLGEFAEALGFEIDGISIGGQ